MAVPANLEQELRSLEEHLLSTEVRANAEALGRVLHDDFVEFGSSGRIFDKRTIIGALAQETPWQYTLSEFHAETLCEDIALVTYRLSVGESASTPQRETLRSSIWKRVAGEWKLFFHQGTRANAF